MKIFSLISVLVGLLLISGCGSNPASPAVTPTPTATPGVTSSATPTPTPTPEPPGKSLVATNVTQAGKVSVYPQGSTVATIVAVHYIHPVFKDTSTKRTYRAGLRTSSNNVVYRDATIQTYKVGVDGNGLVALTPPSGYTILQGTVTSTSSTGSKSFIVDSVAASKGAQVVLHEGTSRGEFGNLGYGAEIALLLDKTDAQPPEPIQLPTLDTPKPPEPTAELVSGTPTYPDGSITIQVGVPVEDSYEGVAVNHSYPDAKLRYVTNDIDSKSGKISLEVPEGYVIIGGRVGPKVDRSPRFVNSANPDGTRTLVIHEGRYDEFNFAGHLGGEQLNVIVRKA